MTPFPVVDDSRDTVLQFDEVRFESLDDIGRPLRETPSLAPTAR